MNHFPCTYCNTPTTIRCGICDQHFCNTRGSASASHIIFHLVKNKHRHVILHDQQIECEQCKNGVVFNLGYGKVSSNKCKLDLDDFNINGEVIEAQKEHDRRVKKTDDDEIRGEQKKDNLGREEKERIYCRSCGDLSTWKPLIVERCLIPTLTNEKHDYKKKSKFIDDTNKNDDFVAINRTKKSDNLTKLDLVTLETPDKPILPRTKLRYTLSEYQYIYTKLVEAECDAERLLKESLKEKDLKVRFELICNKCNFNGGIDKSKTGSLSNNISTKIKKEKKYTMHCKSASHILYVYFHVTDVDAKLSIGDELLLENSNHLIKACIVNNTAVSDEIKASVYKIVEKSGFNGVGKCLNMASDLYTVEYVYKDVGRARMLNALCKLGAVDATILKYILGTTITFENNHAKISNVGSNQKLFNNGTLKDKDECNNFINIEWEQKLFDCNLKDKQESLYGNTGFDDFEQKLLKNKMINREELLYDEFNDGYQKNIRNTYSNVTLIHPPNLPPLNSSQQLAARAALSRPLTLIQGPPGTGKTVTCASIVYNLINSPEYNKDKTNKVLVVANSNTAVDHLAMKIHKTGVKVVRLVSKRRETQHDALSFLSVHVQAEIIIDEIKKNRNEKQKNDINYEDHNCKSNNLQDDIKEESIKSKNRRSALKRKTIQYILEEADVVTCTCITSGDSALSKFNFSTVLIDEAVQCTEPVSLVPIVISGCKRLVLVGDHKQLGPIVVGKDVSQAGMKMTLFERIVINSTMNIKERNLAYLKLIGKRHKNISNENLNLFNDKDDDLFWSVNQNVSICNKNKENNNDLLWTDNQNLGSLNNETEKNDISKFKNIEQHSIKKEYLVNYNGIIPYLLNTQYRMHPSLSSWINSCFYEGSLINGTSCKSLLIPKSLSILPLPTFFYCCYGQEEISQSGTSFLNRTEAKIVEDMVKVIVQGGVREECIGVVTPYEGQRAFLVGEMGNITVKVKQKVKINEEALNNHVNDLNHNNNRDSENIKSYENRKLDIDKLEIKNIDAFQGREKDYIIISLVRSNMFQGIGFVSDGRRLNVTLTRARYGVIIVGNPITLGKNKMWNDLLTSYQERGLVYGGCVGNLGKVTVIRKNKGIDLGALFDALEN